LEKAFSQHMTFNQTYVDENDVARRVRTVKVLTYDDVSPSSVDEIEQVIPWAEVESAHTYRDENGMEQRMLITKDIKGMMYPDSDIMTAMGFIEGAVAPRMFNGDHYFISIQTIGTGKSKSTAKSDRDAYKLIHHIISTRDCVLLVKFVSGEREKYGVIHANDQILMLSILIHDTYQRAAPDLKLDDSISSEVLDSMADKVLSKLTIVPPQLKDEYEDALANTLEKEKKRLEDERNGVPTKPKKSTSSKPAYKGPDDDFMSTINKLFS